jgi:hypothetical protein
VNIKTLFEIKTARHLRIRAAFAEFLTRDPQHAIEHANAAFDKANRAEYERLPVTL